MISDKGQPVEDLLRGFSVDPRHQAPAGVHTLAGVGCCQLSLAGASHPCEDPYRRCLWSRRAQRLHQVLTRLESRS